MLEDPRVNFAISSRGGEIGVNHLGIQVDSKNELAGLQAQLAAADPEIIEEAGASCCYARSDKYWVTDPAGVAWETFHTLGRIPVYGNDDARAAKREACCEPPKSSASVDAATVNAVTAEPCCTPTATTSDRGCCAG